MAVHLLDPSGPCRVSKEWSLCSSSWWSTIGFSLKNLSIFSFIAQLTPLDSKHWYDMIWCRFAKRGEREKNDAVDGGIYELNMMGIHLFGQGFDGCFSFQQRCFQQVYDRWWFLSSLWSWCTGLFRGILGLWCFVGLNLFLSTIIEAFTTEYEELEEADFRLPDFSEATALSNALYVDVKQSLQIPLDDTDPTHEPLPSYRSSDGPWLSRDNASDLMAVHYVVVCMKYLN